MTLDPINQALKPWHLPLLLAILTSLLACNPEPSTQKQTQAPGHITQSRLLNIESEPGSWLTGGRDYQQSYYSPLTQINKNNVEQLGFAWEYPIDTSSGFEATPIVVDGRLYSSGPKGAVYALDAKTGAELWHFQPKIDEDVLRNACCGIVNRGVAVWQGRVYVGSVDGHLYALNASDGTIAWRVDTINDRSRGYTITGAPYIAKDVVVIGNSGAEFDARGYFTAYDVATGEERWRFFTVPGHPDKGFEHPELAMAAKTSGPPELMAFSTAEYAKPAPGIFATMPPKPMGTNNSGSKFLLIARNNNRIPIMIITS